MNLGGIDAAWAYPFDAQTRHLYYSRHTPNAIATCFVVEGLLDAHEATGDPEHVELALRARPFLMSLDRRDASGRPFFGYVQSGSELIHNANMLVCGALARLGTLQPDRRAEDAVRLATETTLSCQRPDGLWPYGEAPNLGWVDNFHTAYLLEGLARVRDVFEIGADGLRHGLDAWRAKLFDADGAARYYVDSRFPLEPHSYASAIDCLLATEAAGEGHGPASRVASSALRELWREDAACFAFRRDARRLNTRVFMRWTNAPMFRSLSRLQSAEAS